MSLIAVVRESFSLGTPLPWEVYDQGGNLLMDQGGVVETEQELQALLARNPMREVSWDSDAQPAQENEGPESRCFEAALTDAPGRSFTFQDMRLRVGDRIQLQPPATVGQERHIVKLIGYLDNASLLVTVPKQNGLRVPLRENDKLVARIFASQKAFGFSTMVERVCKIPYEYMHLSFPTQIQSSVVRKAPRVRTKIIASIATSDIPDNDGRQSGVIVDLSADGALIKSRRALSDRGQVIKLSFRVNLHNIGALLNVQAIVRNVFDDAGKEGDSAAMVNHGVQFQDIPANDSMILQSLIYQQMIEQPHTIA